LTRMKQVAVAQQVPPYIAHRASDVRCNVCANSHKATCDAKGSWVSSPRRSFGVAMASLRLPTDAPPCKRSGNDARLPAPDIVQVRHCLLFFAATVVATPCNLHSEYSGNKHARESVA
jgi:hypothetical protein